MEQAPVREGERVIDAEFTEKTEAKKNFRQRPKRWCCRKGPLSSNWMKKSICLM
ncbi:MAG: hypothetical protein ACLU9P_01870 [[Ruminococcus] torques]